MNNEKILEGFYNAIRQEQTITLATAAGGRVTMRVVSPVLWSNGVLLFTAPGSTKYTQLKENPRCCFALGPYFAEARAEFHGPTLNPENEALRRAYTEKYADAFDEGVENGGRASEFIFLRPLRVTGWAHEEGASAQDVPTIPFDIALA